MRILKVSLLERPLGTQQSNSFILSMRTGHLNKFYGSTVAEPKLYSRSPIFFLVCLFYFSIKCFAYLCTLFFLLKSNKPVTVQGVFLIPELLQVFKPFLIINLLIVSNVIKVMSDLTIKEHIQFCHKLYICNSYLNSEA